MATVVLSVAASVAGVGLAAVRQPDPAIAVDRAGREVLAVLPGGPAWNDGVRAGHTVVELEPGAEPSEWNLTTTDGQFHYASPAGSHAWTLRASIPVAVLALIAALIASMLLRPATAVATAFAVLSLILVSQPMALTGDPLISTAAMAAAPLASVTWLGAWRLGPPIVRATLALSAIVVVVVWVYSRFNEPTWYATAEAARLSVAVLGAGGVLLYAMPWRSWVRSQPLVRGRALDIAVAAALLIGLVIATLVFGVPLLLGLGALAAAALVYPGIRNGVLRAADRFLFAEVRERASLAAVEEERTRLAADVHDVPLQELAGIIHRLELRGVTEETEMLRDVAAHLRAVTTDLRPPVLDDLGLGPALSFLVDQANSSGSPVVVSNIVDHTGIEQERRVPADVEVAVFRIVQEAITNAREHAGATTIGLTGELAPEYVGVTVEDDGVGITPDARRTARERGRLGLTSMTARAASIDAAFVVAPGEQSGTRISLVWRAS